MPHRKSYVDEKSRDYVRQTKRKLALIIADKGWTVETISEVTKIPATNLYRWLDPDETSFVPLDCSMMICNCIGIDIREMFADHMWMGLDNNRYLFLRPLMEEPIERIRLVTAFYFEVKRTFEVGE